MQSKSFGKQIPVTGDVLRRDTESFSDATLVTDASTSPLFIQYVNGSLNINCRAGIWADVINIS